MLKLISPTINQDLPFPRPIKNELECKYRVDKLLPATACLSSHGPYGCSVTLITDQINILLCNRHPQTVLQQLFIRSPLLLLPPSTHQNILEQSRRCNKLRINHHPPPGECDDLLGILIIPLTLHLIESLTLGFQCLPTICSTESGKVCTRSSQHLVLYSHLPNNNNAHPTPKYDGN